ncbi:hypothetical protein [Frankia sp. Cas3]|uniref:hypothetical protein n=1 Tax=Frankia sp. Cas3 TaxID=3073926 RepID=UPI002AD588C6|nr:hypothetical protein [Frankia sp. Cas3]
MYWATWDVTADGKLGPSNDLAQPARLDALRLWKKGAIDDYFIRSFDVAWKDGWAEAWAWLHIKNDLYLYRRARVRSFSFDCGLGPTELAEDVAIADIGVDLHRYLLGKAVLKRRWQLADILDRVRARAAEIEYSFTLGEVDFGPS